MPKHRQCDSVVKKFALPARLRANTYHQPRCTEGLQQTSETPNQVAAEPVASWFIMYPWLHYCIEHKAILCVSAFCQFSLDVVYGFTTTMSVHMYCCCFTGSIWNCDSAGFQFCVERTLCLQNSSCETKLSTGCVGAKVGMSPLAGDTDTLWHVIYCHGVVGAYGYISRRNCFSRLLGFPSARVACVAAEVTRCLGRNFPLHVSRVLCSRHACCGCLLSWLSGSFRRHLWAANVCRSM